MTTELAKLRGLYSHQSLQSITGRCSEMRSKVINSTATDAPSSTYTENWSGGEVEAKDLVASEDIISIDGNDVLARKGAYNPYNKWNTTHGIVHLIAPPNTLTAEIRLGADATVSRKDSRGRFLVEPEALICCAAYGGADRNSDPTIGSSVNALARLGAMITLKNPVGLYMDHIDLAGWSAPDGQGVADLVKIVRGQAGMIERLELEVPEERGFSLSDVTIAGAPIAYGGQIAECITVKLTGIAVLTAIKPIPVSCDAACWIDPAYCTKLGRPVLIDSPAPAGTQEAFVWEGEGPPGPLGPQQPLAAKLAVASLQMVPVEEEPNLRLTRTAPPMRRRL